MKIIYEHQSHPFGQGFLVKEYIQDYFTSPYHFHDLYEIILIKKSFGKLYAGQKLINFHEGDIFIFGPGFGHCFYNERSFIDKGEKAHAIVLFFKADFLGYNFFNNTGYTLIKELLDKSLFGVQIKSNFSEIFNLFNDLSKQKGLDELILVLKILNQLSKISSKATQVLNETQSTLKLTSKDSERLEPVIQYVIENFRENVDSKIAASKIHLNESAFCRFFKRRMEKTFSQFVNDIRISHATELLIKKEWDILRICYECGYKNLSYFNRQFREITGYSPKQYRESFIGKNENLIMDIQND